MIYCRVCIDSESAALDRPFTYAVPEALADAVREGARVKVPFGPSGKTRFAVVTDMDTEPDGVALGKVKPIAAVCGDYAPLRPSMLALARWMQTKYFTPLALCLRAVLPPGLTDNGLPPAERFPPKKTAAPDFLRRADWPALTDEQAAALAAVSAEWEAAVSRPVLLFGVTGSGKTEVYLRLIERTLARGQAAIVLVPEIGLTPQTVARFTGRFGGAVAVTHSRMGAGERFRLWKAAFDGAVSVMIGPRSAVFAPFENLGAIIIDEEHEHSYRSEHSPKFDVRDIAEKRAELEGARLLLGSATPSLETFYRAETGAVALSRLTKRVNGMFPAVQVLDMRREMASGNVSPFGREFLAACAETFAAGKQAILFLNRRGHSTFVSCRWCGAVLKCPRCDVNFTWHARGERLLCHYCGREARLPGSCPACGSEHIRAFGLGTQKVEEELKRLFPDIKALRMDWDTTRGKTGHEKILTAFKKGEAQALVGTQMIAKGLDFPNVVLVGVIAADQSLFTGDFRSGEHTFQLLTQVAGRAGRADTFGRVFLQTYNPEHYGVAFARAGDYEAFYQREIAIRRAMDYPPFTHVFAVLFTGADERRVIKELHKLLAVMRYCNKKGLFEMLGPAPAFVSKVKDEYRWTLTVRGRDPDLLTRFVLYCVRKLQENDPNSGVAARLTLDPNHLE